MKLSPLPYGFRDTCRLIKRDLKNLIKRKTEPDNLQSRFRTFEAYKPNAAAALEVAANHTTDLHGSQPNYLQTPIRSCRPVRTSISTTTTATFSQVVFSAPTSPSTVTEYSSVGVTQPLFPYADAYPKLKQWYEDRPVQELSLEERWILRGIVTVMAIAFCYSPENPSYEMILGDCAPRRDGRQATYCNATLSALLSALDGDRRHSVHLVKCLLATLYPDTDANKLLLVIGDPTQSTRAEEIKITLHHKLSALLLPE